LFSLRISLIVFMRMRGQDFMFLKKCLPMARGCQQL
jgi:hypothetical protein